MKLNINVSDNKSIDDVIKTLKGMNFGSGFDNDIVNKLVDKCYDRCIENLEAMKIYPNTQFRAIKNAISKEYAKEGTGYVKIKSPAIFVELGTGIKGSGEPHPNAGALGWTYGDNPWYYPTDAEASNPNKHQRKNGDWYGYTQGQPARPFAYEATMYIRQIAKSEVRISFKDIYRRKGK